ncbi:MAG: glucose-6-phosphate dehydrogenase [Aeriscardovia sp.]|nr:glucose-6-phosphate dehydrogenase [Aeriscardovia sp.]
MENSYSSLIPEPCAIALFGVTGHLSRHKILPAFYDLFHRGMLPAGFALVGFARREWSQEEFALWAKGEIRENCRTEFDEGVFSLLAPHFYFSKGTFGDEGSFEALKEEMGKAAGEQGAKGKMFYLSIPPASFPQVVEMLKRGGLADPKDPFRKVVIEKPFGWDLESAKSLDSLLASAFSPSQVFRVDHYLGKEMVQNLLPLRFENPVFSALWSSECVDHVEISVAESAGVEGRAAYYEKAGAARDVLQNHLMQLLALTAMEKPENGESEREKKVEALKSCSVSDLKRTSARGQYSAGFASGRFVRGYREEPGVDPLSLADTFAALKVEVNTPRWEGAPFYLRTGKRLAKRSAEVALVLKRPLAASFLPGGEEDCVTFKIQPGEGVWAKFSSKAPGKEILRGALMGFSYREEFAEGSPEAYENLVMDAMLGKSSLFPSEEETELSWKITDELEGFWRREPSTLEFYEAGSWGPSSAERLMERDGRKWRKL